MDGIDNVLNKLDKIPDKVLRNVADGLGRELAEVVNYGKVEYSRPDHGKGFTDRTTNLRNSWRSEVLDPISESPKGLIEGYIFAGWGGLAHYAEYVELRWDGKYAYLEPSINDKKEEIQKAIVDYAKEAMGL